ncbi:MULTISPECIES: 2'-5' RNA ligase family protein [unclassified Saccharibacter]|uniref:2'-5' RNA ligase family protein n=1 Tax=unclassified Saccharibacter TaxID=2648722 RepID=UPI0013224929|nr:MULTISPECIES: 2'-5' RNA ligase family protein [unclassified Saccharibacter]MXV36220.1 hypothetical protein [Saccharibacter sp. EH611]MXV57080.1 hypothetical protein [Saccharibacter sp. EH70]MXV66560.1 hypothetical protein [Saccharibacter sp. EH60]
MKLALGVPLAPFLDDDFSLLRGTLDDVHWTPQLNSHLILRLLGNINARPLLDDIDYELRKLVWEPFSIHFQQVYHRPGSHDDRLVTCPSPSDPLSQLQRNVEKRLRAATCAPVRQRFHPETTLGYVSPGRETDIIPWIQRHNLFKSQPLVVDRLELVELFGQHETLSCHAVEAYGCYGQALPLPAFNEVF